MKKNINLQNIEFSKRFDRQLANAPDEIIEAFWDSLALYLENPESDFLRLHKLKNKFTGYCSINVSDDWRAILKEIKSGSGKTIKFHMIGTHEQLYGQRGKE